MLVIDLKPSAGISGFESPAAEYTQLGCNLDELIIEHPNASFLMSASGCNLEQFGIYDRDILVVDRDVKAMHGDIVVAQINGERVCRVLDVQGKRLWCDTIQNLPVDICDPDSIIIDGVVTRSIRCFRPISDIDTNSLDDDDMYCREYTRVGWQMNDLLIPHPNASYLAQASGDSMQRVGIFDGDILVIDRHIVEKQGDIVIAVLNGELVCKGLDIKNRVLFSANDRYPPIKVSQLDSFSLEGVVTRNIRCFRPSHLLR